MNKQLIINDLTRQLERHKRAFEYCDSELCKLEKKHFKLQEDFITLEKNYDTIYLKHTELKQENIELNEIFNDLVLVHNSTLEENVELKQKINLLKKEREKQNEQRSKQD